MKNLRITVDGKVYQVLVELLDEAGSPTPLPAAAPAAVLAAPIAAVVAAPVASPARPANPAAAAGPGDVKSPLAGKIVSIDVQPGQAVAEGTQVVTIEAMKMNTYIYAHKAGRIDGISITPGQGVEEGQTLLQIV